MGGEDGSLGIYLKLSSGHRLRKAKEQKPWRFPLNRKQSGLLFYVMFVQYTKFFLEFGLHKYLDNLWIHLVRESVHLTVSLGISKTMPLATMSQQPHACWELRNWSTSTWLVCEHFIQIHSCMGMCFSCMYTNNCEHFHKWFGTLYRDNSVLMRVPHIQQEHAYSGIPSRLLGD